MPQLLACGEQTFRAENPAQVAGFISEWWPASNRNPGRLQIGISGRIELEFARVVAAVAGGLSCRKAAERFGVSPASSVRWCALERDQGDPKPKPMGGDQRSQRIEAHADFIMATIADKSDITLEELRERLAGEGVLVSVSTLWRFFARRGYTWKKRLPTRASRSDQT